MAGAAFPPYPPGRRRRFRRSIPHQRWPARAGAFVFVLIRIIAFHRRHG
jgi:hypothetical protein